MPESLQRLLADVEDHAGDGALPDDRLDALNLDLLSVHNRDGDVWIASTVLGGRRVLRVTMMNQPTAAPDVDRVLDGLESLGDALLRDR